MKAYTREAMFWRALALGKAQDIQTPINAKEYYMRLYALKQAGGMSAPDALQVSVPKEETDWLGMAPSDLVEGLTIYMDGICAHVSGLAHYVTGYTAFHGTDPAEQEGHYFPVVLNEPEASTMTIYKNGEVSKADIPYDPQVLLRISDPETSFAIETDTGKRISFEFEGLVLEPKE